MALFQISSAVPCLEFVLQYRCAVRATVGIWLLTPPSTSSSSSFSEHGPIPTLTGQARAPGTGNFLPLSIWITE